MISQNCDSSSSLPSEMWLTSLVERSQHLMGITDLSGNLLFLNEAGRSLFGIGRSQGLEDISLLDIFESDGLLLFEQVVLPTVASNGVWDTESTGCNKATGGVFPIAVFVSICERDGSGPPNELVWIVRDRSRWTELNGQITQRVQEQRIVSDLAQQALQVRWLDLLRNAVTAVAATLSAELVVIAQPIENSGKLHVVAKHDTVAMNLNVLENGPKSQAGYTISTGMPIITPDIELETRLDTTVVRRYGMASGMAVPISQDGQPWGALSLHTATKRQYTEDDVAFLEAVASVLSSALNRFAIERASRHQALHDSLTGLPNRALAQDRLQHALETIKSDNLIAVLLMDLDDFKTINDSLGHESGDRLLMELVPRLLGVVREGDTVARLGGDEFLIVCEAIESPIEAIDLANRVRSALQNPFQLEERSVFLSGSIGITVGGAGSEVGELVRQADTAMYRAKQKGVGGQQIYDEMMGEASSDRFQLATDLHAAIGGNQLWVAYQPIIDLVTGMIASVEALCRWNHPIRGEISPDVFIKLAEETGQIGDLGEWVLDVACKEALMWQKIVPGISLSVNVSPLQLQNEDFVAEVAGILRRNEFPPRLLGMEVTEGVTIDNGKVSLSVMSQLCEMGIELLIDDYGTGYSSLGALVQFSQMSVLKIDKEFVQLPLDDSRGSVIGPIVSLGHAIGMKVVAEGVETQQQLDCIRKAGGDYGQGFLLGRPVGAQEFGTLLQLEASQYY